MAEETNRIDDSSRGVVIGGALVSDMATDEEKKIEGGDDALERVVGAPENDIGQIMYEGEDINQEDIPSSSKDDILPSNEETNTASLEAVPHPQNDSADDRKSDEQIKSEVEKREGEEIEASLEVFKSDELKTAEDKSDEVAEIKIDEEVAEIKINEEVADIKTDEEVSGIKVEEVEIKIDEVHDVPALDSIIDGVIDESTIPNTMRTEEELIFNTERDGAVSDIADEGEGEVAKRSRPSSESESDEIDEEVKSLAPSDKMKASKDSLGSSPSDEDGEFPNDESYQGQSSKSAYQRSEVLELCKSLLAERKQLRKRNLLFQKMLHDYYKKKKAEGTYHEGESNFIGPGPPEFHYRKKLLVFDDIKTQVINEKMNIESESRQLIGEKNSLQEEALLELESLMKQEETLGHGLIDSQTGKILSDKVTLCLIKRQGHIAKLLSDAMLKFIKIRDRVNEAESALKSLEDLGEGLHLFDYERLRVEKQSLNDKIEERDNELSRLREKNETLIITMTHMEQKAYGTNQLVIKNHKVLKILMNKLRKSREKRTKAQKQLIHVRSEIERLYHEAGLLAHHPLLRDFELVLKQVETLEMEVNQMKMHVMMGGKITHPKGIFPDGLHGRSASSASHKKPKSETLRAVSRSSQSKTGLDESKGNLMRGRPSIVRFLQGHGK